MIVVTLDLYAKPLIPSSQLAPMYLPSLPPVPLLVLSHAGGRY